MNWKVWEIEIVKAVAAEYSLTVGGLLYRVINQGDGELEAALDRKQRELANDSLGTEQGCGNAVSAVGVEGSGAEGLSAADSAGVSAEVREGDGH